MEMFDNDNAGGVEEDDAGVEEDAGGVEEDAHSQ